MFISNTFLFIQYISIFLFSIQYYYLKYDSIINQTLISIQHAILVSFNAILYLNNFIDEYTFYNFLGITSAYGIYDIIITLFISGDKSLIFHHIILMISIYYPYLYTVVYYIEPIKDYPLLLANVYLSEISTIFLNISYLMYYCKINNYYNSILKLNNIFVIISYFITRVINFTYLCINLYRQMAYFNLIFVALPFTFLNYHWFYKLCKRVIYKMN